MHRAPPPACRALAGALSVAVLGAWAPAAAIAGGSVAGQVTDEVARPLAGLEVRLWHRPPELKGHRIAVSVPTGDDGAYRFDDVAPGEYRLDVRMPPGMDANLGDRWYDVEEPFSSGMLAADADLLLVAEGGAIEGVDLTLLVQGGLDGRILRGEEGRAGVLVRAESLGECRYAHVDETDTGADSDGDFLGRYFMRGLVPGEYRLIAYDPQGDAAPAFVAGPFAVEVDANVQAPEILLEPLPDDPHEPNDAPDAAGAASVDSDGLQAVPSRPWSTAAGARIAPRGAGDVDWYCLYANVADHLVIDVQAPRSGDGACNDHPWFDPVVSLWQVSDGGERRLLLQDDDSGLGRHDAHLDTGELAVGGNLCVAVSTFGDPGFAGEGQQSFGPYSLRVAMGNRRPTLRVRWLEGPAPPLIVLDEGGALCLDFTAEDPDGDPLDIGVRHTDDSGADAQGGLLQLDGGEGRYCWTAGPDAAARTPYAVSFSVDDGALSAKQYVSLVVRARNEPPGAPHPVSPEDGARVPEALVPLVVENADDPDGDPLKYEFEVTLGPPEVARTGFAEPAWTGSVAGALGGTTSWSPPAFPDDTSACWRARADDAHPGGVGPWSEVRCFFVDATNTPPTTPVIVKPQDAAIVPIQQPTIAVTPVVDPEGDAVEIVFELSEDDRFAAPLTATLAQEAERGGTAWTVPDALAWGSTWYARARARDDRGGESAWSRIVRLRIKRGQRPTLPGFDPDGPWAGRCEARVVSEELPATVRVRNGYDPEGDPIRVQVQVLHGDDPQPLFDATVPQGPGTWTEVALDAGLFEENEHYLIRVRVADAEGASAWRRCLFAVDRETSAVTGLEILAPAEGEVLPESTTEYSARIANPTWPDVDLRGPVVVLAWCLEQDGGAPPCPSDPTEWTKDGFTSLAGEGEVNAVLTGLRPGTSWVLRACAFNGDTGTCDATDTASFHVGAPATRGPGGGDEGCGCGLGRTSGGAAPWALLLLLLARIRRR